MVGQQIAVTWLTVAVWVAVACLVAPGQRLVLGQSLCCGLGSALFYCGLRSAWQRRSPRH